MTDTATFLVAPSTRDRRIAWLIRRSDSQDSLFDQLINGQRKLRPIEATTALAVLLMVLLAFMPLTMAIPATIVIGIVMWGNTLLCRRLDERLDVKYERKIEEHVATGEIIRVPVTLLETWHHCFELIGDRADQAEAKDEFRKMCQENPRHREIVTELIVDPTNATKWLSGILRERIALGDYRPGWVRE